jgi:single-strand DNA-binding protein
MSSINKVILIGNAGRDAEIVMFDAIKKASFSLATSEYYNDKFRKKNEQTQWHNVVCWRNLADIAEQYVKKGSLLYVEGKINYRSWEDKQDNKRYVTEIIATEIKVLSKTFYNERPVEPVLNNDDIFNLLDELPL